MRPHSLPYFWSNCSIYTTRLYMKTTKACRETRRCSRSVARGGWLPGLSPPSPAAQQPCRMLASLRTGGPPDAHGRWASRAPFHQASRRKIQHHQQRLSYLTSQSGIHSAPSCIAWKCLLGQVALSAPAASALWRDAAGPVVRRLGASLPTKAVSARCILAL